MIGRIGQVICAISSNCGAQYSANVQILDGKKVREIQLQSPGPRTGERRGFRKKFVVGWQAVKQK